MDYILNQASSCLTTPPSLKIELDEIIDFIFIGYSTPHHKKHFVTEPLVIFEFLPYSDCYIPNYCFVKEPESPNLFLVGYQYDGATDRVQAVYSIGRHICDLPSDECDFNQRFSNAAFAPLSSDGLQFLNAMNS